MLFGGDMGIIYDEIVGTLPDLLFPIIFSHENADQTIDMKDCNALLVQIQTSRLQTNETKQVYKEKEKIQKSSTGAFSGAPIGQCK